LGVYLFSLLSATKLHFFLGVFFHFIIGAGMVFCTLTVRKNLKEKKAAEARGEVFDTAEEEG